jgi:hypothetical protein
MSRITFTFAKTPELESVIDSLEQDFAGLNRGEIVKLALVEFNKLNQKRRQILDAALEDISMLDAQVLESIGSGIGSTIGNSKQVTSYLKKISN